eukprot:sb/3478457/
MSRPNSNPNPSPNPNATLALTLENFLSAITKLFWPKWSRNTMNYNNLPTRCNTLSLCSLISKVYIFHTNSDNSSHSRNALANAAGAHEGVAAHSNETPRF